MGQGRSDHYGVGIFVVVEDIYVIPVVVTFWCSRNDYGNLTLPDSNQCLHDHY